VSAELRSRVSEHLAEGRFAEAGQAISALWRLDPGQATAGFIVRAGDQLAANYPLIPARVAILRSFTVEPLIPLLRAGSFASGIHLTTWVGDFNAWQQEILDSGSEVYRFQPNIVILAVHTRDIAPELWPEAGDFEAGSGLEIADRVIATLRDLLAVFRRTTDASLILHNLEQPDLAAMGVLDAQSNTGQSAAISRINAGLRSFAAEHRGISILDYDGLVARHGRQNWGDEKKWLTSRLPMRATCLIAMTAEWLRFIFPLTGKIAKVLAVDLDNTLWGGVIGEDGINGIQLSGEYPGAAFQAVQRALLQLHRRGILLAIVSKNNREDALEAIEQHPGMLLRSSHFAALRINWEDKAQNLRQIAKELNIGADAIAFLDDNPVERQHVREAAPEVMVIEPCSDPMEFARAIRNFPAFERLSLSEEDQKRGEYYAADRQRSELESESSSKEDFYRSLRQEAEMALVTAATLGRVAQLTQKTNQFNLTTRRYSEQEILGLAGNPAWQVLSIRVRDRYCDNGLVGVAITQDRGEICEIDSFLLSCRVIGRTVETALIAKLIQRARERGCRSVEGWFCPTRKNLPARDFYVSHGFTAVKESDKGTRWALDITARDVEIPTWIQVRWIPAAEEALA
jgi:FkbH-like protein